MLAERLNSLLEPFKTKYPSLIGIDVTGLEGEANEGEASSSVLRPGT